MLVFTLKIKYKYLNVFEVKTIKQTKRLKEEIYINPIYNDLMCEGHGEWVNYILSN